MTWDFTLEKYSELISALKDNYTIMGVAEYLALPKDGFIAVLRHDVDRFPERTDGGVGRAVTMGHPAQSQNN